MANLGSLLVRSLAVAGVVLAAVHGSAFAQAYPNKPLKLSVGYSPGGPADVVTRAVAKGLSARLGQPVVVENKPGAGGRIALQQLTRADPDGYSLSLSDAGLAVNAHMYNKAPYDALKDFTPIIYMGEMPNFIAVTPSLKVKNLLEFIAYAKAHPGKLNYAATASSTLLAAEMFKKKAGVDIVSVRYKGASFGIPALLAGEVQLMVSSVGTLAPYVNQGTVTGLAVTSPGRAPLSPQIPTTKEAGMPDYVFVNWYCIVGPAGMARPLVDRLNAELRKVLDDPEVASILRKMSINLTPTSPEEFTVILKRELVEMEKIITSAKLKVD